MGCRQGRLVREPDAGLAQGIVSTLGEPHGVLDLLETLGSEEHCPRPVSALVNTGGGQRKQRDHCEEADRKDRERSEDFCQSQAFLWCYEV
jgi:hypothetical protein